MSDHPWLKYRAQAKAEEADLHQMIKDDVRVAQQAAEIRDHIANKTPTRCNPTFMDFDDHWSQVRHFPDLGLARHSVGPRGRSDVKAETYWTHDLLPDTYNTLKDLLTALEKKE